jgi:orotate phosphoribosyltransferase
LTSEYGARGQAASPPSAAEVERLLPMRRGHFLFESGHHSPVWMDLERLCLNVDPVRRMAGALASRLSAHGIEAVCGPLVEGAFLALLVAEELGVPFTYAERLPDPEARGLYPVGYRLPGRLREEVRGRRVGIVNDVVSAGSAVRGTFLDLEACGARPVVIATLAVVGSLAGTFAADHGLALETLLQIESPFWIPADCPLCARGVSLASRPLSSQPAGLI